MKRRLNQEEIVKIGELYKSGLSCSKISKIYNKVPETIRQIILAQKIEIRKSTQQINTCQTCKIKTRNPKFCSSKCSCISRNMIYNPKKQYYCTKCDVLLGTGWKQRKKYCLDCFKLYSKNYQDYSKITLNDYFSKYPTAQAHSKIRDKARKQLKKLEIDSCQKCGYIVFIECCHIKPINQFDRTSTLAEVNDINNLIALCPNCHYELDNGFVTIEQIKMGAI